MTRLQCARTLKSRLIGLGYRATVRELSEGLLNNLESTPFFAGGGRDPREVGNAYARNAEMSDKTLIEIAESLTLDKIGA